MPGYSSAKVLRAADIEVIGVDLTLEDVHVCKSILCSAFVGDGDSYRVSYVDRPPSADLPSSTPAQGPDRAGSARTNDGAAEMAGGATSDGQRRERLASNGHMTTQEYFPDPFPRTP
jgi:hypothetical protein